MKRAFSTVACMDSSWQDILQSARRAGMDAVEIRMDEDGCVCGMNKEELPILVKQFSEQGIAICDLGTSVTFQDYEPEKIARACVCAELAAIAGAKGIRVFLGNFVKRFSDSAPYSYGGIVRSLKELCAALKETGVEVWIETHNEFSTGEVLSRLCREVACDNLKVIWDIIHPIEKGESYQETWRYLEDRIAHVHLKDGAKKADEDFIDYRYTRLGAGELPVKEVIALLGTDGYSGYVSLEWERQWRSEIRGIYEELDELLQDYNDFLEEAKEYRIWCEGV